MKVLKIAGRHVSKCMIYDSRASYRSRIVPASQLKDDNGFRQR